MKIFLCVMLLYFIRKRKQCGRLGREKILVDEREKVISACEKGISSRGFPYVKVHKY